jgi:hypothetical protein
MFITITAVHRRFLASDESLLALALALALELLVWFWFFVWDHTSAAHVTTQGESDDGFDDDGDDSDDGDDGPTKVHVPGTTRRGL